MRIHILSDLHLEFGQPFDVPDTDADVLVLAGDIATHTHGLTWAAAQARGRPVVYVAGNHEYYGAHLQGLAVQMRKAAAELGIHYLDNDPVVIGDTRILGTTLWTDFALNGPGERLALALRAARGGMNDFRLIRFGSTGRFLPEQSVILHRAARAWLEGALAEPHAGPTVVVSHHCPHPGSVPARFRGDPLTPAFSSDLTAVMARYEPALWIHGHTHDAFDYTVGKTRIVCNPRGYPHEPWRGFESTKVVEVG